MNEPNAKQPPSAGEGASYYGHYFASAEIAGSAARIEAKNALIYSRLAPWLPAGAAVLEVGTGKGFFARLCRKKGHPYHGIEASADQCRELEKQGLEMTRAQVPPLPELKERFGLIYSAHLLEHLPDSQTIHRLLSGCLPLLAPGGAVAMLFPDALAMGREFWNCDYTHLYPTTARRVAQAMADAGLEVVASHGFNGHYTGARQVLARLGAHELFLRASRLTAREPARRDLLYRGWLYLQPDVLLVGKPR